MYKKLHVILLLYIVMNSSTVLQCWGWYAGPSSFLPALSTCFWYICFSTFAYVKVLLLFDWHCFNNPGCAFAARVMVFVLFVCVCVCVCVSVTYSPTER